MGLGDFVGEAPDLPADVVLLVEMGGAELVEVADFGVYFYLFHYGGIAGCDGLDFGLVANALRPGQGGA